MGNRATGSLTHNGNNELLRYGEMAYTYDANGNLTQRKSGTVAVKYFYYAENRLVKVEDDLTQTVIVA